MPASSSSSTTSPRTPPPASRRPPATGPAPRRPTASSTTPGSGPDDIRAALRRDALDYLPPDGPILAIQDTTSARLHRPPGDRRPGLPGAPQALAACSCTRCSPSPPRGSPAGSSTSGPGPATRPSLGKRGARSKKATAAKESRRWLDALAATEAALPAGREVITVADREADIYDLFAHPRRPGSHLLIRVKPARGVRHPERLLGPAVRSSPARGTMAVELRRADDRPPRQAVLTIRFLALEVAPPANRAGRGQAAARGADGDPGGGGAPAGGPGGGAVVAGDVAADPAPRPTRSGRCATTPCGGWWSGIISS